MEYETHKANIKALAKRGRYLRQISEEMDRSIATELEYVEEPNISC